MKKVKIEFKYLMIALVVIAGLLLVFSGNLTQTKSQTAYRTTIDGSDSSRVAKWDVVGVSRKKAQEMQLTSGFSENVKTDGDWYFQIENKSEVNAMISSNSKVTFRLMHDSFKDYQENEVTWNFISGKKNEIVFELYAYNDDIDSLLKYQHNTTNAYITYDQYKALTTDEKANYTEQFVSDDDGLLVCTLDCDTTSKFRKTSGPIDGKTQVYFELTFDLSELEDSDESVLGLGATKTNTTFRLHWSVPEQCDTHTDTNNDKICDKCLESTDEKTYSYRKYVISENTNEIEGYTIFRGFDNSNNLITDTNVNPLPYIDSDDKEGSNARYIFFSEPVDFFSYQKYTSTLGGEPMYEFLNTNKTQTLLIPHSKLDSTQKNTIKAYHLVKYKVDGNDVTPEAREAWERLTYSVYEQFKVDYAEIQDSLSYMSYGFSLQIVFDLKVEQVD